MAFPTIAASWGTGASFGTSAFAPAVDSNLGSIASGDLLVAIALRGDGTTDWTDPSGWTRIFSDPGNSQRSWIWAREATGTNTFSLDRSASGGSIQVVFLRITGWYGGTITSAVDGICDADFSGTANPPSLNPTNWDVEDTLWLAAAARTGGTAITSNPTGYAHVASAVSPGTYGEVRVTSKENAAASEDPGTGFGVGGATVHVYTVAIRPAGASDTTAPILSSPTGTATGSTTATVGATTDEANGTQYAVVTTSATAPSAAQIKAGQDHTGSAAAWSGSITISATGANTHSVTGLTASTGYYAHLIHTDAAANDSNIVTSAQFTTSAPADPPVITGQPSNATVKRGQTATFTVTATGSGTVTYQWQRNPGGVGSWADISGATSASYTTPATTISGGSANDQDDYRCNVSDDDAGPVASNVVTLTVQQCVLALSGAGYNFGDGNDPDTVAAENAVAWEVAVVPDELPVTTTLYHSASSTTSSTGYLSDIADDDFVFGTTYVVQARRVSDGEWITFPIEAT